MRNAHVDLEPTKREMKVHLISALSPRPPFTHKEYDYIEIA